MPLLRELKLIKFGDPFCYPQPGCIFAWSRMVPAHVFTCAGEMNFITASDRHFVMDAAVTPADQMCSCDCHKCFVCFIYDVCFIFAGHLFF